MKPIYPWPADVIRYLESLWASQGPIKALSVYDDRRLTYDASNDLLVHAADWSVTP